MLALFSYHYGSVCVCGVQANICSCVRDSQTEGILGLSERNEPRSIQEADAPWPTQVFAACGRKPVTPYLLNVYRQLTDALACIQ